MESARSFHIERSAVEEVEKVVPEVAVEDLLLEDLGSPAHAHSVYAMLTDASRLMLEAWYYMPYGLLLDLCAYHIAVRWWDGRT